MQAAGSTARARTPPRARAGVRRAASRAERSLFGDADPGRDLRLQRHALRGRAAALPDLRGAIRRVRTADLSERDYYEACRGSPSTRSRLPTSAPATRAYRRSSESGSTATGARSPTAPRSPGSLRAAVRYAAERAPLAIVSGAAREEILSRSSPPPGSTTCSDRRGRRRRSREAAPGDYLLALEALGATARTPCLRGHGGVAAAKAAPG